MKTLAQIKKDLYDAYEISSNEVQENACLKAIGDIMDSIQHGNEATGTQSEFMVELRDFLLKYIDNN